MLAKVCLVGPKGAGKSTIVSRIDSSVSSNSSGFLGAIFAKCNISINDKAIDLQIWDISGEDKFRCMGPIYYKGAKAALCMFDLTSEISFKALDVWIKCVKQNSIDECVLVVLGNKVDLEDRHVSGERGGKYAVSVGAKYFEVSAISGKGILDVLLYLAKRILQLSDCYVSYIAKLAITSSALGGCRCSEEMKNPI